MSGEWLAFVVLFLRLLKNQQSAQADQFIVEI